MQTGSELKTAISRLEQVTERLLAFEVGTSSVAASRIAG
jgi:hypothetical protein